jgi:hypothetical protein
MIRIRPFHRIALAGLLAGAAACVTLSEDPRVAADAATAPAADAADVQNGQLPCRSGSVRFGVIGDFGDGKKAQYTIGQRMAELHAACEFDTMLTTGDNIYGSERPQDFARKFELPYKPLLDGGVKFYASLGNHDDPNQRFYKPFNMGEKRFYSFTKKNVQFFALDSNYLNSQQLRWIEAELKSSKAEWKLPYLHHPLYSSGDAHGSSLDVRRVLEPLFLRYGVQVVFAGHDHFYERTEPQKGIYHFVSGSAGKLREGDVRKTSFSAAHHDAAGAFMLIEVEDDAMFFTAVTESGRIVDAGCIPRVADLPPAKDSRVRCPAPPASGG